MKTRHILFLLLAVLTAATSCVYDYNPQIEGEGGYLIVEGNIVIGDMCNVRLDYSWSLVDTTQGDERWRILASSNLKKLIRISIIMSYTIICTLQGLQYTKCVFASLTETTKEEVCGYSI